MSMETPSPDLRDLYQEMLLEHYRHPRNYGAPAEVRASAVGDNPLCGDHVRVFVDVSDGRLRDVSFEGTGCAISTASASMMTEALKGKTVAEARRLFEGFHALLAGDAGVAAASADELEPLACLSGVRAYPMRVKCATLAWHTLRAALEDAASKTVSTE
jgi:nitrogen fixation NifU-like protein